jgi:redox-sensitive bicupin YhaK (pirin superfamily)
MFAALSRRPPPLAARPAQRVSLARSAPFASAASAPPGDSGTMAGKKCKEIREILKAPPRHWVGNGFHVFPVFHNRAFTKELSPWLMFDYAAPKEFSPSYERRGVGQHPHRGFETITIAFNGEVEHGDSVGNRDVIGPGDVQWMTAARGIIHEEFHSTDFQQTGGVFEMCQLWLNLPAKHKMDPPKYQPILAKDIPIAPLAPTREADNEKLKAGENSIRVIAGDEATYGVKGAATTHTPVELLDIRIAAKDVSFDVPVPEGHNTIVFVRRGAITVGEEAKPVNPQGVALMHLGGDVLRLSATEANTEVLLLAGEPIDEPIAARGPFVMNTHEEIMQANKDFMNGLMGR